MTIPDTAGEMAPSTWLSPTVISLIIASVVTLAYNFFTRPKKETWDTCGIPNIKLSPSYFIAEDYRVKVAALLKEHGNSVGFTFASIPGLITVNLDLLRNILIKDFSNFVNRSGNFVTSSPIGESLFFAQDDAWRRQRHIVSPTFTTGKLRHISKSVNQSAQNLANFLEKFAVDGTVVPIKNTCGRYTSEVIAKTGFGLNASFIGTADSEFYEHAKNMIYSPTGLTYAIRFFLRFVPSITKIGAKVLKLQMFDRIDLKSHKYFKETLRKTIDERRSMRLKGVEKSYPDFLDLIMKANERLAQGRPVSEEEAEENIAGTESEKPVAPQSGLTDDEMLGMSMLIIFAGMETTASTLQMCLYELAYNPDVQEKVYQEIQSVVKTDTPTQEEFGQLTYTEQVINETLRLYTPLPTINRIAKERRTYGDITILKGASVMIPLFYIFKDPKIYPDPEKFDPDRFSKEEREKRDPLTFMPFGQGPRICLGMRLAYLELKAGLVHVLRKVRVVLNDKTQPKTGEEKVKTIAREMVHPTKDILLAFELRK